MSMHEFIAQSLPIVGPELILSVGAMVLLMVGTFVGERSGRLVMSLAVAVILGTALWLLAVTPEARARCRG